MQNTKYKDQGFTLFELLIVLGILGILALIILLVINPAEYLRRSRDVKRITDLNTLHGAIVFSQGINFELDLGFASTVYVSLPDSTTTCANWGLPALPPTWVYHCVDDIDLQKTDGTGWLPINFNALSTGSPLSNLPIDPVNSSSTGLYYTYNTGSWRLTSLLESERNDHFEENDGGIDADLYELGYATGPSLARGETPAPTPTSTPTPIPTPGCTPNTWAQKADFASTSRSLATGFSIGNKGYVGTGSDIALKTDFYEYDPVADSWASKADFGGPARSSAAGFSIGSKGYIGTGYVNASTFLKDFWEYDLSANSWAQKADFASTSRYGAAGFSIGSKGYIGTGYDGTAHKKDLYEYDPVGNAWTAKANFGGNARYYAAGFSMGSRGYIGPGYGAGTFYKDFWEYNPVANAWNKQTDFGGDARNYTLGFSIGNQGYIGTGYKGTTSYLKDFWEYDLPTNVWTQKAPFGGTGRYGAVGFSTGGRGYIGTGYDGASKNDFWEYCPATPTPIPSPCIADTWTRKADFGGTARSSAVGFSIGSKGYIGTGYDSSGERKDLWEYNPSDDTWIQKANLGGIERYLASSFSIGNKAYIGTGYDYSSATYMNDFWEYDRTGDVWTQKADFGGTARYAAVGFAIGSNGYIGTGYDSVYRRTDFFEYNPTTNTWCTIADFPGTARGYAVGFSIGSKGYVGTGHDGSVRNDFYEYDPNTNVWASKANFGGLARYEATGFSVGDKGYLGLGWNSTNYYKDFWEYNPSNNTWVQKADFAGGARILAAGFGFSDGNRGYLGAGSDSLTARYDFWEYCSGASPTITPTPASYARSNTWCRKADLPFCQRFGASGLAIDDKGYAGLGVCYAATPTFKKDWWEYDPATDSWTQKNDFGGIARRNASELVLGNSGYVTTGYGGSMPNDVWVYDSDTGFWATTTAFAGGGRENAVGFTINGVGYIGTGVSSGSFGKWDFWAYAYNPISGQWAWTQKADVTYPGCPWSCNRAGAVGFVIGNKGYIATGYRDQSPDGLELLEYDSGANTWTRKTDYGSSYARQSATAFVLNNLGYVGLGGLSGYFWDFWAYNPDTDSWAQKGNFPGGPRSGTFEFVIDGKAYVGAGMGNSPYCPINEYCKDFWQYNP